MEAVDAGDVPLSAVIDRLFSPEGLSEMIGTSAAACFVLARSVLVPNFFEQLIDNVETIDATLRDHVAFVVFHGRNSSLVTPPGRPGRYREDPDDPRQSGADLRYHIDGLSFSDERTIRSRDFESWRPAFDDMMMARIRSQDSGVPVDVIASTTERATNMLMERFGIREAQLPCLLFVDGGLPPRHVVVPLDHADPMRSLYTNVLAPLADEFGRVRSYWEIADEQRALQGRLNRVGAVRADLDRQQAALAEAEAAVEQAADPGDAPDESIAAARAEVATLERLDAAFDAAATLDAKLDAIPEGAPPFETIAAMRTEIATLDRQHAAISAGDESEARRDDLVVLRQKAHRLRAETGRLCKEYRDGIRAELLRLGEDPLRRVPVRLIEKRAQLRDRTGQLAARLAAAEAGVPNTEKEIADFGTTAHREAAALRDAGYDDAFLAGHRPDSIAVVTTLVARGAISIAVAPGRAPSATATEPVTKEGPWTKWGVIFGGLALLLGAIPLVLSLRNGAAPPVKAPPATMAKRADAQPAAQPPVGPKTRFDVTMVDTERNTRAIIYAALKRDTRANANPLGRMDEQWPSLAQDIGCSRPDVVVAHLHAFRTLKGPIGSEDYLFGGLRDLAERSPGTRFVLYSSTFGKDAPPAPGERDMRIITDSPAARALVAVITARLGRSGQAAKAAYGKLLGNMTFAVWPLKATEGNSQELREIVATAGLASNAKTYPLSPLCPQPVAPIARASH